ncbi:hypothetical protein SRABI27_03584 [Pedobacter sp. Bi27]|nr:hypothetical protein SRABI36_00243 [Pedobacter sp. Bi36]CAH0274299.1 hypothetical protein SRABI27_03584 [Pedobacter sp. Bi27]
MLNDWKIFDLFYRLPEPMTIGFISGSFLKDELNARS